MNLSWRACLRVGVSIFLLYLAIHYWTAAADLAVLMLNAALPLLLGCVIAYLVNLPMCFYERYYFPQSKHPLIAKTRRGVCMLAAFFSLIAVAVFIIRLIVPQLTSCVQLILAELPGLFTSLVTLITEWDILPETITDTLASIDWQSKLGQIIQMLTSGLGSVMEVVLTTVSTVFSGIVTALLSLIFAIYLLAGKESLAGQFHRITHRYLKPSPRKTLYYVLDVVNDSFHSYIVGQCTEAVIIGGLCTAGMLLLQLPYATMIGALVGFTALIPVAGAYIGAFVGAFMIMTVSPVKALIFLIFIVVLQQLEGNIVYPRVVGASMGLPGIWVLAAVTIGGGVLGIPGMLLGVPLAAAAYQLIRNDVNRGLESTPELSSEEPS